MRVKKNIAISESGFIFDPNTGDSFSLNQIGLEIVNLLKQGKPDNEIIPAILEKYDIDSIGLDKYYYDFIAMLQYYQLLDDSQTSRMKRGDHANFPTD